MLFAIVTRNPPQNT